MPHTPTRLDDIISHYNVDYIAWGQHSPWCEETITYIQEHPEKYTLYLYIISPENNDIYLIYEVL